ncbi:MAG: hypothetical protein VW405_20705 [Rhodospirillaceae bacterium]
MNAPRTRAEEAARILAYARERLADLGGCTVVESFQRQLAVAALGGDVRAVYRLDVTLDAPDAESTL